MRAPSDFLAVVPYLLGFHPTESLVCLFLGGGSHRFAMRIDLPSGGGWASPLADMITGLAERHRTSELMVIGYTAEPDRARPELGRLAELLADQGLVDLLLADPERWWSLTCLRDCCPDQGTPYDVRSHPLAVQAVVAGLGVEADRDALRARTAGPPEVDVPALQELADTLAEPVGQRPRSTRMTEMGDLVRRHLAAPGSLDDADCVRLALLALDVHVRDVAWSLITRADAEAHVALWHQVVARTPPPLEPAPLCLLAVAGWIGGNGALLNCGVERLAQVARGYSMADLLAELSHRAIPPDLWEEIGGALEAELDAIAAGADLEAAG